MEESRLNKGDVTPEEKNSDDDSLGTSISVFKDEKYTAQDVTKVDILDFGDEGFLLKNLLTTEECRHIINTGESLGFKPIKGFGWDYRSSQRIMLRCPELSNLLFARTLPYLKDIVIDGDPLNQHIEGIESALKGTWSPIGLNEIWRLCKYQSGGHFGPHFDGHFDRSLSERSLKTFMIYLNADFDGGTTNFVDEKQGFFTDDSGQMCAEEKNILCRLQPLEGQAVIFNHHRLHEGGKLLNGVKYILRTDVMYKRSDGQAFNERQEKALLLLQDAGRYELSKESDKAADCYRRAYKLWTDLEDSV